MRKNASLLDWMQSGIARLPRKLAPNDRSRVNEAHDLDILAKCAQINKFHTGFFAYYLERLKATPDGDGNLLDHSLLRYGSAGVRLDSSPTAPAN